LQCSLPFFLAARQKLCVFFRLEYLRLHCITPLKEIAMFTAIFFNGAAKERVYEKILAPFKKTLFSPFQIYESNFFKKVRALFP
jgi:hypothetical protein